MQLIVLNIMLPGHSGTETAREDLVDATFNFGEASETRTSAKNRDIARPAMADGDSSNVSSVNRDSFGTPLSDATLEIDAHTDAEHEHDAAHRELSSETDKLQLDSHTSRGVNDDQNNNAEPGD